MFPYITYNDLITDIRKNIYKIPKDIDGIIAIPRSGLIPASIISLNFNLPITTLDIFLKSKTAYDAFTSFGGGGRMKRAIDSHNSLKKFLVVEDNYYTGNSIKASKEALKNFSYEFVYCAVYLEGIYAEDNPALILRDIRDIRNLSPIQCVLYEWNIFNNHSNHLFLYDIDGLVFYDPPCDRVDIKAYEDYIKKPILKQQIANIDGLPIDFMSYRLNKYRKETYQSLVDNGINVGLLFMFNSESMEERSKIPPYLFKGDFYKKNDKYLLYFESDDYQAKMIHYISGKPVFSFENNCIYN